MYRLLLFTIFVLAGSCLFGQSGYRFKNISVSDGLSQNTVTTIFEDSRGFMWFGTQDGLNRYDGSDFKIYRNNSDSSSLSDNFITAIAEDGNGFMWIGTRSGLNRLDPSNGKCIRLPAMNLQTFHSSVNQLLYSNDGRIFSNEVGQLNLIPQADNDYSKSERIDTDFAAAAINKGELIVIDNLGTVVYNQSDTKYPNNLLHEAVGARFQDQLLLVWNTDTLQILKNGTTTQVEVPSKIRDAIFYKDQFWIATETELFVYNSKLENVTPNITENPSLRFSGDDIHSFVIDSFNQLWFGTNRHGAFVLPKYSGDFIHLSGQNLEDPIVWSAALVDSSLFIGTTTGVEIYSWHNYPHLNAFDPLEQLEKKQSWKGFHAACLYACNDQVYAGTRDGRILEFKKTNDGWILQDKPLAQGLPQVFSLISDADRLLASSSGGLFESVDYTSFIPFYPKDPELLRKSYFLHVALNERDRCILSTTNGLIILDPQTQDIQNIPYHPNAEGLGFAVIASTLPLGEQLYISTLGRGIDRKDENGNFMHWTADNGLRNEVVYGAVPNNLGDLWFSTNDGLSVLSNGRISANFSIQEGTPFTEHGQNSFGSFDKHMWFGGINGIYFIDRDFKLPHAEHRLLINEILINNKSIAENSKHLEGTSFQPKKISLYPADNSLVFDFTLLTVGGRTERLAYRLEGVDQEWITVTNKKQRIQYTTLPSGNHTLEIVTMDFDNQVQSSLLKLPIEVHPPFWQTIWFAIIVALFSIVTIAFIIRAVARRRIKEQLRKEETLRRIQEERERISMDLHDNIGAQITHVITSLDNLSYKIGVGQQVSPAPAIDELGDFARGTMQQLRDTIWTLKKDDVYLVEFIDRIQDYYRRIFQDHENLHLTVVNAVNRQIQLKAETTVHLFRIMQEVATNALKHAKASAFSVHFSQENEHLIIEIEDNGKGFDVNIVPQDHYGLKNITARVKELNGKFLIESRKGRTYIKLEIPVR
ncbi:MAG: hypothetical protein GC193_13470 [Cryomorphaceae bacterium]|nr:hypothetical protein [Cryomorphaceae bacterium]